MGVDPSCCRQSQRPFSSFHEKNVSVTSLAWLKTTTLYRNTFKRWKIQWKKRLSVIYCRHNKDGHITLTIKMSHLKTIFSRCNATLRSFHYTILLFYYCVFCLMSFTVRISEVYISALQNANEKPRHEKKAWIIPVRDNGILEIPIKSHSIKVRCAGNPRGIS